MTSLTLIGIGDDGTHLVVETPEGVRMTLPISDELRRMVRHAMPTVAAREAHDRTVPATMSPREIQQRLRAGLTPPELAELSGESLAAIEKFAPPVLAERAYVIEQARGTRIGRDSSAPVLDDLVTDRLAARGIDAETVSWEAWRATDEPWRVAVDFKSEGRSHRAMWTYDHSARSLTAEDDEARWLTETELLDAPIPRRHLSAVRPQTGPIPLRESRPASPAPTTDRVMSDGNPPSAAIPMPSAEQLDPTEVLLEQLADRRGRREVFDIEDIEEDEDDEAFEGFGPAAHQRTAQVSFSAPSASTPVTAPSPVSPGSGHPSRRAEEAAPATPAAGERKPKKGRASVPSWDEIVFGAKSQQD